MPRAARSNVRPKKNRSKGTTVPRIDAAGLAGVTTLMNLQHVNPSIDLDAAEREIMGRSASREKKSSEFITDPVEIFKMEIKTMSEELGIDLDEEEPDEKSQEVPRDRALPPLHGGGRQDRPQRTAGQSSPAFAPSHASGQRPPDLLRKKQLGSLVDDIDLLSLPRPADGSSARRGFGGTAASSDRGSVSDAYDDVDDEDSGGGSSDGSDEEDGYQDHSDEDQDDMNSAISDLERELGIDLDAERGRSKRRRRLKMPAEPGASPPGDGRHWRDRRAKSLPTEEQEQRQHSNAVMGDLRHETRTSFGVERERVQDVKAGKLEQIGQLRLALEEDGVDCTAVGNPAMGSSVEEIDSVLNILRLKNDRNRYSSLAEEVLLGGAEAIETVLDGSRAIPLIGWKPDYRGYHNTLNVKLHRMRYETSSLVGSIIQRHNIGPTARILMEILPSFFLYPRQQRRQRGTPGLHDDPGLQQNRRRADPGAAYVAIRASDEKQDLTNISGI